MCNCKSLVRWVAVLVLLIAVSGCLIGLIAPFWALYEPGLPLKLPTKQKTDNGSSSTDGLDTSAIADQESPPRRLPGETEGLWARCNSIDYTDCILFWENNFLLEDSFPLWHQAAQALYLIGAVALVACLVISCFNICCCRCCLQSSFLPTALGALTIIGVLPILASIVLYGSMAYKERNVNLMVLQSETTTPDTNTSGLTGDEEPEVKQFTTAVFDWAYYVAVASVALCLVSAALFLCDGRRKTVEYDGRGDYKTPDEVE